MELAKFAETLGRRESTHEITREEEAIAKQSGFVVVFSYSDDGLIFKGAIDDYFGAFDGVKVHLINDIVVTKEQLEEDIEVLSRYRVVLPTMHTIEAIWNPDTIHSSWLIKTSFKSIPFDVYEEEEEINLFCRGAIFKLGSIEPIGG